MRYGKSMVYLFTILFAAVAAFFWGKEPIPEPEIPIKVTVFSQRKETIDCWKDEAGEYYVFLPSYAQLSQVEIQAEDDASLDGQSLMDGITCSALQLNTAYDLSYTEQGETVHQSITFTRSAGVPTMYIDVRSGSMDYIHAVKGNEEAGTLRLYTDDGRLAYTGNLDSFRGRGNATWMDSEKKPYSLKLASEADLLGMGQAEKWILLANACDPSHLRNKLAYDFAAEAGLAYSPQSRWVDLYLNGDYAGLYLLCERNEVHPQRVALTEGEGFLVSTDMDWRLEQKNDPFFTTDAGMSLRIQYSSVDTAALAQLWQSLENALAAEDEIDPVTGKAWWEFLDLDSWARKFLVEELFGNGDAGAISQFFYGSGDLETVYAGPVWDFDISMGNSLAWRISSPSAFMANRPHSLLGADASLFYKLYQKDVFYAQVTELYETTFQPLLTDYVNLKLEQLAAGITQAAKMNQLRWSTTDLAAEVDSIQSYMNQRIAFFNSIWLEEAEYCMVTVDFNDGGNTGCYAVRPGEYATVLMEYEKIYGTQEWYTVDADAPFDITKPISEDISIYRKQTGIG